MKEMSNILVTGATSGIGFELVKKLLNKGDRVFGIGRNKEKVASLIKNENFHFLSLDLSDVQEIEQNLTELLSNFKIDGFVNCAGMEETMPLTLYKPKLVQKIYDINVFSTFEIIRVLSKKKFSNDGASFVLISSVMGELGQPGKTGYCSSKSAIIGLVRASALELSKRAIRVNAISPGVVNTPMTKKLFDSIDLNSQQKILDMHPLGIGEVEDVVPLIDFLLSTGSRWITGQNIMIDGGYSIQ